MVKASFCVNHKMDLTLKREMHVYSQIKKTLNSAGEEVGGWGGELPHLSASPGPVAFV